MLDQTRGPGVLWCVQKAFWHRDWVRFRPGPTGEWVRPPGGRVRPCFLLAGTVHVLAVACVGGRCASVGDVHGLEALFEPAEAERNGFVALFGVSRAQGGNGEVLYGPCKASTKGWAAFVSHSRAKGLTTTRVCSTSTRSVSGKRLRRTQGRDTSVIGRLRRVRQAYAMSIGYTNDLVVAVDTTPVGRCCAGAQLPPVE